MQQSLPHFLSFAPLYQAALPMFPSDFQQIVQIYLEGPPIVVADLGCRDGVSTLTWQALATKTIGIDSCEQNIASTKQRLKNNSSVEFLCSRLSNTYLGDSSTDVAVCSASNFYDDAEQIEKEIYRILRPGGIFVLYGFTAPPLCGFAAEKAYGRLQKIVTAIQNTVCPVPSARASRENHLFSFSRNVSFCSWELCDADRFLALTLGQEQISTLLNKVPDLLLLHLEEFEQEIHRLFQPPVMAGFCFDAVLFIK